MINKLFNQIRNCFSLLVFTLLVSCGPQNNPEKANDSITRKTAVASAPANTFEANRRTEIDRNVLCIYQDKNDQYWFGTDGGGVYRYDGNNLILFTDKDGLCGNQVRTIQEDRSGTIWFETGGGVCRFDGKTFTTLATNADLKSVNPSYKDWNSEAGDLWFASGMGNGLYRDNGSSFTYLSLAVTGSDFKTLPAPAAEISPYTVYSILKDRSGNVWFGTQTMGVCRYDVRLDDKTGSGKPFTWFTEKGLSGPAVRALFEDRNGNIWFGNNGYGLFRYDGKTVINFTEEKGLGNPDFLNASKVSGKPGPGTLARINTVNEDADGNLWIGTIDAGAWRYDGKNLVNYTFRDGLAGDEVNAVYKDKKGKLWFGTNEEGVYTFDGKSFTKFVFLHKPDK